MTTAERDHACTPTGTILTTIMSIAGPIRDVYVRQRYKRDRADKMTRPSSAILPHVPSTTTVIPPATHGTHTDCANSSPLSATAVADHASHALTCHDGDRVMERPNRNRNESPPVLPAPALPPTLCCPFTGGDGHSPNTCNVTHPMVLRLPAVSTKLYLQPADGRPFPSES